MATRATARKRQPSMAQVVKRMQGRLNKIEKLLARATAERAELVTEIDQLLDAVLATAKKAADNVGRKPRSRSTRRPTARRASPRRRASAVRGTYVRRTVRRTHPVKRVRPKGKAKSVIGKAPTRKELISKAKSLGVKGSDRMTREQLEQVTSAPVTKNRTGKVVARNTVKSPTIAKQPRPRVRRR